MLAMPQSQVRSDRAPDHAERPGLPDGRATESPFHRYGTTDVHRFYVAAWCGRRSRRSKPRPSDFERSMLEAVSIAIGENLARDAARVERLAALDVSEWQRVVGILELILDERKVGRGLLESAVARLARGFLIGIPPSKAGKLHLKGGAQPAPGHLFVARLDDVIAFEAVRTVVDDELRLRGPASSDEDERPSSDELLRHRGKSLLVALLEAIADLPDKQRLALALGMWRADQPEFVRASLRRLVEQLVEDGAIPSLDALFPIPAVKSDKEVARYLSQLFGRETEASNVAANRSAGRKKLLAQNAAYGALLDLLLPYRSTTRPPASESERVAGDEDLTAVLEEAAERGSFRLFELGVEEDCERFSSVLPSYVRWVEHDDRDPPAREAAPALVDAGLRRHLRACTRCRLTTERLAGCLDREPRLDQDAASPVDQDRLPSIVQRALVELLVGDEPSMIKTRVAEGLGTQLALDADIALDLEHWLPEARVNSLERSVKAALQRQIELHPDIARVVRASSVAAVHDARASKGAAGEPTPDLELTLTLSPTRGAGDLVLVHASRGVTGRIASGDRRVRMELYGLPEELEGRFTALVLASPDAAGGDGDAMPPYVPSIAPVARASLEMDLGEEAPWMRRLFEGRLDMSLVAVGGSYGGVNAFKLAVNARTQGELIGALAHSRRELMLVRRAGDRESELRALARIAGIRQELGQYAVAHAEYERVFGMARELANSQPASLALARGVASTARRGMGECLHAQGDVRGALVELDEAVSIAERLGEQQRIASTLVSKSLALRDLGDLDEAVHVAERAREIFSKERPAHDPRAPDRPDQLGCAAALNAWALAMRDKAHYEPAFDATTKAIELCTPQESSAPARKRMRLLGELYCTRGRLHLAIDDFDSALEAFSQSLTLMYQVGYRRGEADAIHATGRVYHAVGFLEPARASYERSLAISRELGDRHRERVALGTLARLHLERADALSDDARAAALELGLDCAEKALELARSLGDVRGEAITLTDRARLLMHFGPGLDPLAAARQDLERARRLRARARDQRGMITTLVQLADVERRANHPMVARDLLLKAQEINRSVHNPRAEVMILRELGQIYVLLGREHEALPVQETAVERVERLRRGVSDPLMRDRLFARYSRCYEDHAALMYRRDAARAFAVADAARGRLFLDHVASSLSKTDEVGHALDADAVLERARCALPPDAVMLSYLLAGERAILFAVTHSRVDAFELDQPTAVIEERVRELREAVLTGRPTYPHGRSLYSTLLGPAEDLLAGARELVISPDGCLHELPFALLLTDGHSPSEAHSYQDWTELPFLLRRWAVSYAPSLGVLDALVRRSSAAADDSVLDFLMIGADARPTDAAQAPDQRPPESVDPQLIEEAERLVEVFDPNFPKPPWPREVVLGGIRIVLGSATTRRALQSGRRRARFVHVAARSEEPSAIADAESPVPPGLWLDGDALWLQDEITRSGISADLLTLSCDAGASGPRYNAEGPLSIARSFAMGGAAAVCASLGPIATPTATEFHASLYGTFKGGVSAADALRRAQLELVDAGYPVLHWGMFQLLGVSRPADRDPRADS